MENLFFFFFFLHERQLMLTCDLHVQEGEFIAPQTVQAVLHHDL